MKRGMTMAIWKIKDGPTIELPNAQKEVRAGMVDCAPNPEWIKARARARAKATPNAESEVSE